MKKIYLLFFTMLTCLTQAQTLSVLKLQDETGKQAVDGVQVILGKDTLVSDKTGIISQKLIQDVSIRIFHPDYLTVNIIWKAGEMKIVWLQRKINQLSEVVVTAFEINRPLLQQAAAIARISEEDLHRFNENSFVNAFNTKAGVRIEQRSPASYRVSIRGSSVRAPFGVRNVKVYWNDMPFTSPDGTTPLNLFDLSNIDNAQIIKGPAGSIYGASNGGVIQLNTNKKVNENQLITENTLGSYNFFKSRLALKQNIDTRTNIQASFVHQEADGYRDHSASQRNVLQISGYFFPTAKQTLSAHLFYSDLDYQIPGALTLAQRDENRHQSRPGSIEQNSSISQQSVYGLLSYSRNLGQNTQFAASVYVNTTDFENPFILDYKEEESHEFGGRAKLTYDGKVFDKPIQILVGGEFQQAQNNAKNFGNIRGVKDTLRFADDLKIYQGFFFQQLDVTLHPKLIVTFALSENFSQYDIDRTFDALTGNPSRSVRNFDVEWIPRVAFSYTLDKNKASYFGISSGFSPPTIDEVRTNEGSINSGLDPERGTNYEWGFRGGFFNNFMQVDLSAFYFRLRKTITTFTNDQGVVLFRNSGNTNQYGLEAQIDYHLLRNGKGFVKEIKLSQAYTGHFFRFDDLQRDGENFSGNKLPGVSPHTLVHTLDVQTSNGFYTNLSYQFTDDIPLNDSNTVYQDSYHFLTARLGWKNYLSKKWSIEIYAGLENILDEAFSFGNDLNPFGGRFFQPAAGINGYGGLKLRYLW